MSIMLEAAALRVEPNGERKGVIANLGDEVEVLGTQEIDALGGGKESWTKIQLLDADGVPEGWVHSSSIDPAGAPPDAPIDLHKFARQCWWERMISGVNPYYLVAVAELRSKVSGGQEAGSIGSFRLTQAEWNAGRIDAQFGLGTYRERDIADWRMQCVMFARMALRAEEALTSALTKQPTWVELYLAQMIGPQAAAAAIKSPNGTVAAAVGSVVKPEDFPPGGLTGDQLLDRYAKFLRDPGPPPTAVKALDALDRFTHDLQTALNIVRAAVDEVGSEFLGDGPNDERVSNAKDSIPTKPPDPETIPVIPIGDDPPLVPGAGGILGELIAAHESGRAGYNAYNRGNAGDSGKPPIKFSLMTIQEIMNQQSLPKGNANRLFAVGKYQLIPVTMKDAVSKLGINHNNRLTQILQEKLFRNYLVAIKRPAVKAYITGGNVNLGNAQMALAFEFASVARPDTGRSNYGGIGGNRASVTAQQTLTALNQERVAFQQNLANGMSSQNAWAALSPGGI